MNLQCHFVTIKELCTFAVVGNDLKQTNIEHKQRCTFTLKFTLRIHAQFCQMDLYVEKGSNRNTHIKRNMIIIVVSIIIYLILTGIIMKQQAMARHSICKPMYLV